MSKVHCDGSGGVVVDNRETQDILGLTIRDEETVSEMRMVTAG